MNPPAGICINIPICQQFLLHNARSTLPFVVGIAEKSQEGLRIDLK